MRRTLLVLTFILSAIVISALEAQAQLNTLTVHTWPNLLISNADFGAWASLTWDSPGQLVDVYMLLIDEEWGFRFLTCGSSAPQPDPVPFFSDLWVPEGTQITHYPLGSFPAGELAFSGCPGTYFLCLALTEAGTYNLVCDPAISEFVVLTSPSVWSDSAGNSMTLEFREDRWFMTELAITIPYSSYEDEYIYYSRDTSDSRDGQKAVYLQEDWAIDPSGLDSMDWTEDPTYGRIEMRVDSAIVSAHYSWGFGYETQDGGWYSYGESGSLATELRP